MKLVMYSDPNGFLHRAMLRDDMRSEQAEQGIPADPPDIINGLDWEELKKNLHNHLVELGLFSIKDLQNNNLIASAILTTFQRPITDLYRKQAANKKLASKPAPKELATQTLVKKNGHLGGNNE